MHKHNLRVDTFGSSEEPLLDRPIKRPGKHLMQNSKRQKGIGRRQC